MNRHCRGCFNQDVFCVACGGTGSVTDRIPAADAIADADTALLYGVGRESVTWAISAQGTHDTGSISYLYERAASAAFREIPGLRA